MVRGRVKKMFITSIMIILSLFIYSAPASAVELSDTVEFVANVPTYNQAFTGTCTFNNNASPAYGNNPNTDNPCSVQNLYLYYSLGSLLYTNNYVQIPVYFYNLSNNNSLDSIVNKQARLFANNTNTGDRGELPFVGTSVSNISNSSSIVYYYFKSPFNGYNTNQMELYVQGALQNPDYVYAPTSWSIWAAKTTSANVSIDNTSVVNAINNQSSTNTQIKDQITQVNNTFNQMQTDANNSGTQSQTDSNSAGQQVESATTNLIGVIGGFFGAFINANPTNCIFNMGIILEEVDMCSAYIPTTYNVILSIVSLLFIVPMAIWLINSILNAFKEFQE